MVAARKIPDTNITANTALSLVHGIGPLDESWVAYDPTVTSTSGSLTSVAKVGSYKIIGTTTCTFKVVVQINDNGTGSGGISISLPIQSSDAAIVFPVALLVPGPPVVIESGVSISSGGGYNIVVYKYDGTYPVIGALCNIYVNGIYELLKV